MTWTQLYYLFGTLAAVVTLLGFFRGPVAKAAAWVFQGPPGRAVGWVFQSSLNAFLTLVWLTIASFLVFGGRYAYLYSCTGEGKAKECIRMTSTRTGLSFCLRKLVLSNELSVKRGREILHQWDKQKAEFEKK